MEKNHKGEFIIDDKLSFREKLMILNEEICKKINKNNKYVSENKKIIYSFLKKHLDIALERNEIRKINSSIVAKYILGIFKKLSEEMINNSQYSCPELKKELINLLWIGLTKNS
ncbi:MAG: hypothetical protein ACOC4G_13615 [Bacillota bacterium]